MNVRRSRPSPAPSRPSTPRPASRLLNASTAGWYAEWKARKAAAAPPRPAEPHPTPVAEAPDALARWLTGAGE